MRLSGAGLGVVVTACAVLGCGDDLPREDGVLWECTGRAIDCVGEGDDAFCFELARFPDDIRLRICADPTVGESRILDECRTKCEYEFRAYGLFSEPPFLWRDIEECQIGFVSPTSTECRSSPPNFGQGGPAQAEATFGGGGVPPSTVAVDVDGSTGSTTASGSIRYAVFPIEGSCPPTGCTLVITELLGRTEDFTVEGASILVPDVDMSDVRVFNHDFLVGTWLDGDFIIPPGAARLGVNFRVDGERASVTLRNDLVALRGTIDRDTGAFVLPGAVLRSGDTSIRLTLLGRGNLAAPTASISPTGILECGETTGVSVVLDAGGSTDPDDDLRQYQWRLGAADPTYGELLETSLEFGTTDVVLQVTDSIGAVGRGSETLRVVDTTPPVLEVDAPADCLWPPNQSWAVLELGSDIVAEAQDACDPSPLVRVVDVRSSQPSSGRGTGPFAPDAIVADDYVCLRSERAGVSLEPRIYEVVLETSDVHGNIDHASVMFRVPHERADADCTFIASDRYVPRDDVRCAAGTP